MVQLVHMQSNTGHNIMYFTRTNNTGIERLNCSVQKINSVFYSGE